MQAAFFKLAEVIPTSSRRVHEGPMPRKTYGKKGDAIVKKNWTPSTSPSPGLVEIKVPQEWANATTGAEPVKIKSTEYFPELR